MEKAGTGGALFMNLYRDFLKESYQLLKVEEIKKLMIYLIILLIYGEQFLNYL